MRWPCHLCQHQALSSAKTCQQTLRGEQCQQAAAGPSWTVNTEPFHSPQQGGAQQLQLPLSKYQQGIYITIAVPTALNTPPPVTIMFPTFSFPSIHTLIKKERSHKYIMEKKPGDASLLLWTNINAETYPALYF